MEYINIPDHPTPVPLEVGLTSLIRVANTGPRSSRIIQLLDWQDDEDKYIMVLQQPFSSMDLRGVLHRDIKLENILVNTITLIDFGCGALLHDTPYYKYCVYCPPEFFNEGKYFGKPATVYSLGVLLFYLVCGHFPKNKDRKKVENWEWSKRLLSKECCDLLNSCLHPNPRERIPLDELLLHDWFQLKAGGEKNFNLNFR
ncbi:hypothetical protein DNTS_008907 [Danionella cerebrum]|uniref:non-specific serine/threonine protein kinase n=1 Tax=Danionella cerebrum TaxID=2873325 RepID=A0A553NWA2_9TELE|nr:hypothetical protein DNTS_008907 [Danionella translucida]